MIQFPQSAVAIALVSMLLMIVSLVTPEPADTMLAAIGLTGLLVTRVVAMRSGWAPRAIVRRSAARHP